MNVLALPYWALMLLFVCGAVAVSCGGHAIVRRYVPYADLVEHNDVAGFMIAIVGVIYAVLLAFVVVVVWQQYDASDANYGSEASEVANVHAYARSLPVLTRHGLQSLVHRYVHEMIADEWPAMRAGRASSAATATLGKMFDAINAIVPHGTVEENTRSRLVESVQRSSICATGAYRTIRRVYHPFYGGRFSSARRSRSASVTFSASRTYGFSSS